MGAFDVVVVECLLLSLSYSGPSLLFHPPATSTVLVRSMQHVPEIV
jgi:hypothetical protein